MRQITEILRNAAGRKWRITLVIALLACTLTAWGAPPADTRVTVNVRQAPAHTVLNKLQKDAGLNFIYSADVAKTWPAITLSMKNKPASQVIAQLAEMINCNYSIRNNVVTITPRESRYKQKKWTLKGKVVDEIGEPLIGVTVKPMCPA